MAMLVPQQIQAVVPAVGGGQAAFDLGMAYSSGSDGMPFDLVQAHRWLNIAALFGHREAIAWRAEIAAEMSMDEVAEAQRLARITRQEQRMAA